MRKFSVLVLLLAVAAFVAPSVTAADQDLTADQDLSVILSPEPTVLAAKAAYCQANCLYGADVSCSGSSCSANDDPNGWVQCDGVYQYCPPPQLSVQINILDCRQIGAKSIYDLRAYASGGSSYTFSWSRAIPVSGSSNNPNNATSTDTVARTASVTVTSGSASGYDDIYLPNPCSIIE